MKTVLGMPTYFMCSESLYTLKLSLTICNQTVSDRYLTKDPNPLFIIINRLGKPFKKYKNLT